MACQIESEKKYFTYIWKIENASYYWPKMNGCISSPFFVLNEIDGTKWCLVLSLRCGDEGNYSMLCLKSFHYRELQEITDFTWELAFLALDGTVVLLRSNNDLRSAVPGIAIERENLFVSKRSKSLPGDTLTARVRISKNDGEMLGNVQFSARTIVGVEKRSFTWEVRSFSSLKQNEDSSYEIKSLETGVTLMAFDLFSNGESESGDIYFSITRNSRTIKCCRFQLYLVQGSGNMVQCLRNEFRFDEISECRAAVEILKRSMLMGKKSEYLPNEVLSLQCMCCFTSGKITTVIEGVSSDYSTLENHPNFDENSIDKENILSKSQRVLGDKIKSMLKNSIHTDIQLRTSKKRYPVHKCILSTWSSVFETMFSNEMREKIKDCVEIEDLNDDTVFRLLQYFYSAEFGDLEWDDAIGLYEAADKYQVITLKDICSSFLKTHLCRSNACAALLLADLHQDKDLKSFVQDFILRHSNDILNSEEWEDLMKTNLKLAAETMHLKFKE